MIEYIVVYYNHSINISVGCILMDIDLIESLFPGKERQCPAIDAYNWGTNFPFPLPIDLLLISLKHGLGRAMGHNRFAWNMSLSAPTYTWHCKQ